MKIIYILGDGRSGSTLLESILANNDHHIAVGECYRFWERYYSNNTICSCGLLMNDCDLWSKVHLHLKKSIKNYDVNRIKSLIKKVLKFNFHRNSQQLTDDMIYLQELIKYFYEAIVDVTGKTIIIDSSKSPGWALFIKGIFNDKINFIHLERNLVQVANSWKKKIRLPEFIFEERYMPVKSDLNIIRTWLKVKILASKLSNRKGYTFINYSDFLVSSEDKINEIESKFHIKISNKWIWSKHHHAIAGNPVRQSSIGEAITLNQNINSYRNLNKLQLIKFSTVYFLAKILIR